MSHTLSKRYCYVKITYFAILNFKPTVYEPKTFI